jgi:hypothetical protein
MIERNVVTHLVFRCRDFIMTWTRTRTVCSRRRRIILKHGATNGLAVMDGDSSQHGKADGDERSAGHPRAVLYSLD